MFDLFLIGLFGFGISQIWLIIIGYNIINVKMLGYSCQDVIQQIQVLQFSGVGYMGLGSQIVDVCCLVSDFFIGQLCNVISQNSELSVFCSQIEQFDGLLFNIIIGVSLVMQCFFVVLQVVVNNFFLIEVCEVVFVQVEGLGKIFNIFYDQLDKQNSLINQ